MDLISSRSGRKNIAERAGMKIESASREDIRLRCQRTVWIPAKEGSREQSERTAKRFADRTRGHPDVSRKLRRSLWRDPSRTWTGPCVRNHERCECVAHPLDGRYSSAGIPCCGGEVQVQALLCRQLRRSLGHRVQGVASDQRLRLPQTWSW